VVRPKADIKLTAGKAINVPIETLIEQVVKTNKVGQVFPVVGWWWRWWCAREGGGSGAIHCLAQQQRPDHSLQWLPRLPGLTQVLAVDKEVHSLTAHSLTAVQLHMLQGTE
jgi:hypothetical protein